MPKSQPSDLKTQPSRIEKLNQTRRSAIHMNVDLSRGSALTNWNAKSIHQDERKKSCSMKLKKVFVSSTTGRLITLILSLLANISAILYILQTYFTLELTSWVWLNFIDLIVSTALVIEWGLNLCINQHRFNYIFSPYTIYVAFITLPSILPSFFYELTKNSSILIQIVAISRILRLAKLPELFKAFRLVNNNVTQQIINIITFTSTLMLISAAIIQLFQLNQKDYKYHDWVYFIVVSISTVGFGDINPQTVLGKLCVLVLIVIALVIIPRQTSYLLLLMDMQSTYARQFYKSSADSHHVLIFGETTASNLKNFSKQLFHPDHGTSNLNVVILNHKIPEQEMVYYLNLPLNDLKFTYLQGSVFQVKDLKRGDPLPAKAFIIMTNKFSKNAVKTDQCVILQSLQLKKFLFNEKNQRNRYQRKQLDFPYKMIIQLIKPESRIQYFQTQNISSADDQLIVVQQIKMNLLAKSCFCPGIISLCCNLIISSGNKTMNKNKIWINQYLEGMGHEIYRVRLGNQLNGENYTNIVKQAYQQFKLLIIGLEIKVFSKVYILLNPGQFVIDVDKYDVHAYVISTNQTQAMNVTYMHIKNYNMRKVTQKFDNRPRQGGGRPSLPGGDDSEKKNNSSASKGVNTREFIQNSQRRQQFLTRLESEKKKELFGVYTNFDGKVEEGNNIKDTEFDTLEREDFIDQGKLDTSVLSDTSSDNSQLALKEDYYLDEPRNLTDVIYDTFYGEMENHIVVCGLHSSIYQFILPLRAKYLKKLQPIVIITDQPMEEIWCSINRFKDIYLVEGSPFEQINLWRANIGSADKAVILGKDNSLHLDIQKKNEEMLDADSIFIYKAIKNCNPNVQIMAEVVYTNNIEFLTGRTKEKLDYQFQPLYCAGQVYISSVIDMLSAQAYYNPHIVKIIQHLLTGTGANKIKQIEHLFPGLSYANLFQIAVPEEFYEKPYKALFMRLLSDNIVTIGLYRMKGATDNEHHYVFTNPTPHIKLTKNDKAFVLGCNIRDQYFMVAEQNNKNMVEDIEDYDELLDDKNQSSQSVNMEIQDNFQPTRQLNRNLENTKKFKSLNKNRNDMFNASDSSEEEAQNYGSTPIMQIQKLSKQIDSLESQVEDIKDKVKASKYSIQELVKSCVKDRFTSKKIKETMS